MRSILNKILSIYFKILNKIDHAIFLPFAASSKFTSSIYLFFNRSFRREHYSVVKGKWAHLKTIKQDKANEYLLTRNIHRLEKGLIMKPRKPVFAKKYIFETVSAFEKFVKSKSIISSNKNLIIWADNVLNEYFKVVNTDSEINKLKDVFLDLQKNVIHFTENQENIPYERTILKPEDLISYDQFMRLSLQRRSVRWFLDKKVPRSLVDKAIEASAMSPSACNRQPFEFRVFDEPELVQKIGNFPMGTTGFSDNFQTLIVVVGKLEAYFSERDRHLIYIDGSLASMTLMLALETLGLSSCPINWPDIESREKMMQKELKLSSYERPIMLIAVGYPDPKGKVPFSAKKNLDKIRKYNYEH